MANSIGKVQIDFVAGLGQITTGLTGLSNQVASIEKDVQRSARSIGGGFDFIRNAIAGVGFVALAKQVISSADAFANISARLKLATGATQDFQRTFAGVVDIAQRTSTSLEETANLYGRISKSLTDLGRDGAQAGGIVETINQTLALSGASAQSSAAALQQLNQALASGVLRGEEFNSVNEQAPLLLEAIGRATGKTVGELRKLAQEGRLTAEVVIGSLQQQADVVGRQFEQLPLTVGRAFQQLRNAGTVAIGELFGDGNADLAEFISGFADGVLQLPQTLRAAINACIGFFDTLRISAVEQVQILALGFAEAWERIKRGAAVLGEQIKVIFAYAFDFIANNLGSLYEGIADLASSVGATELAVSASNVSNEFKGAATAVAEAEAAVAKANTTFLETVEDLDKQRQGISKTAEEQRKFAEQSTAAGEAAAKLGSSARAAAPGLIKFGAAADGGKKAAADLNRQIADGVSALQRYRAALDPIGALADQQAQELDNFARALAAGKAELKDLKILLKGHEEAQRKAAMGAEELTRAQSELNDETAKANKPITDLLESLRNEEALLRAQIAGRTDLIAALQAEAQVRQVLAQIPENLRGTANVDEIRDQLRINAELERQAGLVDDLRRRYEQFGGELADSIGHFAVEALSDVHSIGDAFDELGQDIADTFKRAVAQALSEMARLQLINPLLNSVFNLNLQTGGGGAGGLLQGVGSLFSGGGLNSLTSLFGSGGSLTGGSILGSLLSRSGAPGGGIGASFVGPLQPGASAPGAGIGMAGNVLGAAAGAYGVYSAYRSGSPLSGAISGAVGGASLAGTFAAAGSAAGPIGAIVGAIIGALAGFLGGPKPPDIRLGGVGVTRKPEEQFTTPLGNFEIGVRGGVNSDEFKKIVTDFDTAIAGVIANFSNGADQFAAVQTALATFAIDLKGDAVSVENVLGARFGAILATFSADAQAFVGATGTIEERVQRLADFGFIEAALEAGKLTETFGELASILKTQQTEGEAIQDTYERVAASTALFEAALDLTGSSLDLTRVEFVNLATDIVDAAGGLQRAAELWQTYYDTFYSDTERATAAQAAASRNLVAQLADVGLDAGTTKQQFRAIFENLLPTMTPEQIAQYLEAAEAFAQMDAALGGVTETVEELNAIAIATPEQLAQGLVAYREFTAGITAALDDLGASEFRRSLTGIRRELEENTQRANDLAVSAGLLGATQEDLADIQLLASRKIEQAIAALRQRIATLANSLYGPLARVTRQIAERQEALSVSSSYELGAIQQISEASANRYEAELQALKQIAGFLDSLKLDTALTTLTPEQRVGEARGQFERLLGLAQGGDTEALQQLTGAASAYLREARSFFASGSQYTSIFDFVTRTLGALGPTQTAPGTGTPGGIGGQVDTQLAFLEAERERLTREQDRAERQAQVLELIGFLRELSAATSTNILELAGSFQIPLADLVTDLGVNLEELSATTAVTLSGIANQLGVELSDLARSVGIDLGSLADDQSLLNDALEQVIAGLPAGSAAALAPLLQAVEDATTEADANEAIQELTLAALNQPVAIRNQLAPFLDGLDLAGEFTDLDFLGSIAAKGLETADNTYISTLLLTEIRDLIANPPAPLEPIPIDPPEEGDAAAATFERGMSVLANKLDKLTERVGGVELQQGKTAQAIRMQTEEMGKRR